MFIVCAGLCWVAAAAAQELHVRLSPETVYVGDVFRMEVSSEEALQSVNFTFAPEVQTVSRGQQSVSINGRVSSSFVFQLVPGTEGPCRLTRLTAQTQAGKTLTFRGQAAVAVQPLEPDPAIAISLTADPERPMPGDAVTLRLDVRAPALMLNGRPRSPFWSQDLFGRQVEARPRVSLQAELGDDSPLRLTGRARSSEPEIEGGTNWVWRVEVPYVATRAGEQFFPAPIVNDRRVASINDAGEAQWVRCLAQGKPLTVTVVPPPTEGRPEGFIGAIGRHFSAEAEVDAHNVRVGDPVRLTVRLFSDGDPTLLRPPAFSAPEGFRAYGEPARERFEGGCAFAFNLRPIRAGLLEIPPLSLAWFDRAAEVYREVETAVIPLRVRPSAQWVLMGEEEGQELTALPPPLILGFGLEQPRTQPARWAWAILAVGVFAGVLRLLVRPVCVVLARLKRGLGRHRPTARAVAALRAAQTPDAAAAALRIWAGRPALTAPELHQLLKPSPEAGQLCAAYERLEQAIYAGGQGWQEARDRLAEVLPQVCRVKTGHSSVCAVFFLAALIIFPAEGRSAEPDVFVRERAEARAVSATSPEAYAQAAELWLGLARGGDWSRATLLNGASCAILARRQVLAQALLTRYRWAYGSDAAAAQALRAAYETVGEPVPLGAVIWPPKGGVGVLADGACVAAGLCLLVWACLGWRHVRVTASLAVLAMAMLALWVMAWVRLHAPLPQAAVAAAAVSAAQGEGNNP